MGDIITNLGQVLHYWWPIIITTIAVLFLLGVNVRYKIPEIIRRVNKLEEVKYVSLDRCEVLQDDCASAICKKMDENKKETIANRTKIVQLDKTIIGLSRDVKHLVGDQREQQTTQIVEKVMESLMPVLSKLNT